VRNAENNLGKEKENTLTHIGIVSDKMTSHNQKKFRIADYI
jgi:hypothetical protein